MHLFPTAARPADADDDAPFGLIGGPVFNARDPWQLPARPAPVDSTFTDLDPLQQRRHLAARQAVERHISVEHFRRLDAAVSAFGRRVEGGAL